MRSDPNRQAGRIQVALHGAAEAARRIDTRTFELGGLHLIRAALVPAVSDAVSETVSVLDDVLGYYDQPSQVDSVVDSGADSGVFNSIFEELVELPSEGDSYQRLADISFMARWELDRKREAVASAERRDDDWQLISECCSARRRVVKAASGVERVLCEVEGLCSLFTGLYRTEEQCAIETRAVYYSFVSGLHAAEQYREDHQIERCVRLAGIGIARLIGRSIYEELRIEDRRTLRELQVRLIDWLRSPEDRRGGPRIFGDLSAFASLLMGVNRRAQLVDYDCRILEQLVTALIRPPVDRGELYTTLETIRGRDPELDELINTRADLRGTVWQGPAERVLAQLKNES